MILTWFLRCPKQEGSKRSTASNKSSSLPQGQQVSWTDSNHTQMKGKKVLEGTIDNPRKKNPGADFFAGFRFAMRGRMHRDSPTAGKAHHMRRRFL